MERINSAQADLDQSVKNAKQETSEAADGAKAKWAQLKADAAAKREAKANMDKRELHLDAKVAATDANWARPTRPSPRLRRLVGRQRTVVRPGRHPRPRLRRPAQGRGHQVVPTELVHHAQLSSTTVRRRGQDTQRPAPPGTTKESVMTTSLKTPDVKTPDPLLDTIRAGAHEASAAWGGSALGALWIGYGMFVLSFQTGSLAAVASLIGVAFLFGGTTQLVVAAREPHDALAEHHRRNRRPGRRPAHLRVAGHHPLRGVDHGGLLPDRLRHHPHRHTLAG